MGLTSLDIIVLLIVGGAAVLGVKRGFVQEVLSLGVWLLIVLGLKFAHTPLTGALVGPIGSTGGAAVLAFALIAGALYFGGRMVANRMGRGVRSSVLGPVDRALGFGFGALKGLVGASLLFLLLVLVTDTLGGGPSQRPEWVRQARTYPLLNATSGSIADFIDRRRQGEPVWGDNATAEANMSEAE
jgi:membrane protein required for colicin V production